MLPSFSSAAQNDLTRAAIRKKTALRVDERNGFHENVGSPEPVGLIQHHQLYSGVGAYIVMESITLRIPQ